MYYMAVAVIVGALIIVWQIGSSMANLQEETRKSLDTLCHAVENEASETRKSLEKLYNAVNGASVGDIAVSLDRLCNAVRENKASVAKIAVSLDELQTWLCGSEELRKEAREEFQLSLRDSNVIVDPWHQVSNYPLLPQVVDRLNYLTRAVEKMAGEMPAHEATQTDLERALDTAMQNSGPLTMKNGGLILQAARDNLKGKHFDGARLRDILLTRELARLKSNEGLK